MSKYLFNQERLCVLRASEMAPTETCLLVCGVSGPLSGAGSVIGGGIKPLSRFEGDQP